MKTGSFYLHFRQVTYNSSSSLAPLSVYSCLLYYRQVKVIILHSPCRVKLTNKAHRVKINTAIKLYAWIFYFKARGASHRYGLAVGNNLKVGTYEHSLFLFAIVILLNRI